MEVRECKGWLRGGFTAEQIECLQAAWLLRGKCKQHSSLCHSRVLLCSTIKCSLLLGGGVTKCVNVIWVGDEDNGAGALLFHQLTHSFRLVNGRCAKDSSVWTPQGHIPIAVHFQVTIHIDWLSCIGCCFINHFLTVLFMNIAYGYESHSRHGDYLLRPIVGLEALLSTCECYF